MPFFGVPIRNGLPIGLGSVAGFGVQQFDPSQLFAGGTVAGAWYDPSDLSTLFDSSAGTTPVAMPGQGAAVPVGLMLDKSQGLVLGSELFPDGACTSTAGWTANANTTLSIVSESLRIESVAAGAYYAARSVATVAGNWYKINFDVTSNASPTNKSFYVGTSAANTSILNRNLGANPAITTYSNLVQATSATTWFTWIAVATAGGESFSIDNISVKALPGNHAISFNNTTARPELRARVNLLVATATLSTQNVTTQATSYTLSFAGAGSITLSGTATGTYSAGTHTITCTAGTLTLTVSGTVTTADLRPANSGALLPAYQAVVDANTYDTSGFPLYLLFEGAVGQRGMYTPANLNLSGTDKVAVFAGVRKLSDAAAAILTELSAVSATTNGSFSVVASTIDGGADRLSYGFNARGTVTSVVRTARSYAAPITNVVTAQYDNAAATIPTQIVMRVNGVTPTTQADPFGPTSAGNYGTYPLYIGARNNSSLWLNGQIYSLIIAGSAVSAGNISATEQWVAGKTGIAL